MLFLRTRFFYVFLFCLSLFQIVQAQNSADSLLKELPGASSKSEIYNLLAEATIEDSLELSRAYAEMAMENAFLEENQR